MAIAQLILCCTLLWCTAVFAAGDAQASTDEAAANFDFYFSNMLAERQKLHSGDFVVSGTKTGASAKGIALALSGKMLISCAFDEERIRLDNLEPVIALDLPDSEPPKLRQIEIERKYFRTPDACEVWFSTSRHGGARQASSAPDDLRFCYFDVHLLGLLGAEQLRGRQTAADMERVFEGIKRNRRGKSVDVSDPDCQQIAFEFRGDGGRMTREMRYWIRRDQGFTPIKYELRRRHNASPEEDWEVLSRTATSWKVIDGVWVPVALDCERIESPGESRLVWKIRWRSVNQPIDDKRFSREDFGVANEAVGDFSR